MVKKLLIGIALVAVFLGAGLSDYARHSRKPAYIQQVQKLEIVLSMSLPPGVKDPGSSSIGGIKLIF